MAKSYVGIDIGYDGLKLAVVAGKKIKKMIRVDMPEKMLVQGRVVSVEAMGTLIRETVKKNHIRCKRAAVLLPEESVFVRNVSMPIMTEEQLRYNLPFEFRDYITEELNKYMFDYAMQTEPSVLEARAKKKAEKKPKAKTETEDQAAEEEDISDGMDLLAVAVPKEVMDNFRFMMKKAGLLFSDAAPAVSSYSNILAAAGEKDKERCIIDLGYHSVRMYIFKGDCHSVTRELEVGLSGLESVIADLYNVDVHLAHTYLNINYENCQNSEACKNFYGSISVELMRAVHFYQFSNPDSNLEDVYVCGGGSRIEPLVEELRNSMNLNLHLSRELLPSGSQMENSEEYLQAIGMAMH